jgi:hypothetical protein
MTAQGLFSVKSDEILREPMEDSRVIMGVFWGLLYGVPSCRFAFVEREP